MSDHDSPIKRKFISYLKKRFPNVKDKDLPFLLNDIQRFVKVVQKIYTEPQASISIQEKKIGKKTVKTKIYSTDMAEVKKVFDKTKSKQDILETMRKFHESVSKDKYGR